MVPGSGRLVRQTDGTAFEEVVGGLMFPVALKAAPDGALSIALPAFGADDGSGQIVQVDPAGGEVTPVADAMTEGPECAPAVEGTPAEAPRAPDAEMGTPEA
jgi:3-deoxy-D-arabino-heptulosonate 7-phosphate (DAHP) synthase